MKLMEEEKILMEIQPESNLLIIWFFTRCLSIGVLAGILGFFISTLIGIIYEFAGEMEIISSGSEFEGWSITAKLIIGSITGSLGMILVFIYCVYLKRTYIYMITNRRCVFSGGILRYVQHSVPYHKITDVEMSRNIIERMLGISSLGIYTPGTGSMNSSGGGRRPEIAYIGLKDNESPAEMINSILSKFKSTGE